MATRAMNESVTAMQGTVETYMECGTIAAEMSRKMSEEIVSFTNEMLSSNVELSKDIFACRTINDLFDLQTRMVRSNLDAIFSESARFSEMIFNYMNQAAEPISERLNAATNRFSRNMAA